MRVERIKKSNRYRMYYEVICPLCNKHYLLRSDRIKHQKSCGCTRKRNPFIHIQNVKISVDLAHHELFELGKRGPYHRFINFPTNVTCLFTLLGK